MGFPESFVGTGVLDCPFRTHPKKDNNENTSVPRRGGVAPPAFLWRNTNHPQEGILTIYRIQRLPCGKDFASEFEFALQMSSSCHRR